MEKSYTFEKVFNDLDLSKGSLLAFNEFENCSFHNCQFSLATQLLIYITELYPNLLLTCLYIHQ